jgi:hypothetical protein
MADAKPPRRPTPPPGTHDRRALLQAYQDVVRTEQDKRATQPLPAKPESRVPFWVAMGLLIVCLTGILVLQPAFLFPKPPEEGREIREASLRVRMYLEIDRIEQFRSANSRLPQTLIEAGADTNGLTYNVGAEGYSLAGVSHGITLSYVSGQSPKDFLGTSYQLIAQRRHR